MQTTPSHWDADDAVALAREVYAQLLAVIDTELSPAAIDLPDVLPVATKVRFDAEVGAALAALAATPAARGVALGGDRRVSPRTGRWGHAYGGGQHRGDGSGYRWGGSGTS